MVTLSFVQGRLSNEVAGKYQYFPIHNWRNEFDKGREIGFKSLEWIISDFSNPIFDPVQQKEIINLCIQNNISISSISLDLLMSKTLDNFKKNELSWIFKSIKKISKKVNLLRVSIPVEETSGIRDPITFFKVQNKLVEILNINKDSNFLLAVESDMAPLSLRKLLSDNKLKKMGILLDVGNIAAYGYKLEDYFKILSKKIYSIHIKDRKTGIGPSVKLGSGDAEFEYLSNNIHKLENLKDVVLQTFKTNKGYLDNIIQARKFVIKNILKE